VARKKGTVGERLTTARLEHKLTITEIQQITKIQVRYLEAIEKDQFTALPGVFYVRAFIRQYASAVGEDATELVDIYDGKIEPYEPEPEELPKKIVIKEVTEKRLKHRENKVKSLFPFVVLGILALAIVIVVVYFMFTYQGIGPKIDSKNKLQVDKIIEDTSSTEEKSKTRSSSSSSSNKRARPVEISQTSIAGSDISMLVKNIPPPAEIVLKAVVNQTWIQVLDENQKNLFEGMLTSTDARNNVKRIQLPENARECKVRIGAPTNTELTVNGVAVDLSKYRGFVPRIIFSLQYLGETIRSGSGTRSSSTLQDGD